mgnify:FL=1|tara:strand:+ start:12903 stop:13394 length:492 start_codon:yes stop_codon:yes gene_type:complete
MEKLANRISAPELLKELDNHLDSVHTELELMEHAFKKGDFLRASNALLAASRMSDTLSRLTLTKELIRWSTSLETINSDDVKNFTAHFQLMLEREYEKNRLDSKLCDIQNMAEKGFAPRESVAGLLRELASEIEDGGYPILLKRSPTREEIIESMKKAAELQE